MPKLFEECVRRGGRVRRISYPSKKFNLKKGEYINICFLNGRMFLGEKHKIKNNDK